MGSSLNVLKEQAQTSQPLLLASFVWNSGLTVFLSTHNLSAISGGYEYGGNNYLPRLLDQNLSAVQALSDQGVSLTPTVTLKMADADAYLYNNIEAPYGFKGAVVTLTFVMIDMTSGTPSTDSAIKFVGVSGPAQLDDKTLTVTAVNKINLAPQNLPKLKIQPFCPWIFPTTAALQQSVANGTNQQSKECPYNPAGTSNQLGNLNTTVTPNVPYTSCGKTKANCQARGMYSTDSSGRQTGTFGGIQYNPPSSVLSRQYAGHWQQIFNTSNVAKYNDLVPLMYGMGWMQNGCMTLNQSNDANYTSMEVLICYGPVDDIFIVTVNGIEIPHVGPGTDTVFPGVAPGVSSVKDALKIGYWAGVNNGGIKGIPNPYPGYNSLGDPYGSLCVLFITVVNSIASPGQPADVEVLFRSAGQRVYSSTTVYTVAYTPNPVWHIMDALTWLNLEYEELNIQSFINEAAYCDEVIPYISPFGVSSYHSRFAYTLPMRQRLDGASAIRQMLNGIRAILIPNYATGLLGILIKKTLADQQPAPVDGSNYNTEVASYNSSATSAGGYFAYYFGANSIAEDDQGNTTLKVTQEQMQAAPNELSFLFQDSENTWSSDSILIDEDDDIALTGAVMPGSLQIAGPNTYDHGQRIIASWFGEHLRGNPRLAADGETIGDTGGSMSFQFETSVKAAKLAVGQIIAIDAPKYNLVGQPLRIRQIQPTSNFERVKITADWHNDAWYFDFYGQTGAPKWTNGYRSNNPGRVNTLLGGAASYLSDVVDPVFNTATSGKSLSYMGLAPVQYITAGGAASAILVVRIAPPVNVFDSSLQPPFTPVQGMTANTGGALPGNYTYYIALAPLSANGVGHVSQMARVFVAAGTNTNTISVSSLFWDAHTTGYQLFAGIAPDQLFLQNGNYSGSGGTTAQPETITITGKLSQLGGPPDPLLSKIRFRAKSLYLPGIFTALLSSAVLTGSTWSLGLTIGGSLIVNSLAGRKLALLGRASAAEADIYPSELTITANTANTLTVNADALLAVALQAGDQITVRMQPTIGSDGTGNYIQDALFVNPYQTYGLSQITVADWVTVTGTTISTLANLVLRITQGTGEGTTATIQSSTATKIYIAGEWVIPPDSTSVFVVENPSWFQTTDTAVLSNNGTMGIISCTIDASAYRGQCVLIEAIPVDVNGNEGLEAGTPVREVYLLGSGGGGDSDAPPAPNASIGSDLLGDFTIESVGFSTLTNASTVSSITLTLFTWDCGNVNAPEFTLAAAMSSSSATLTVTGVGSFIPYVGQLLAIDTELVSFVSRSGNVFTVLRGAVNSVAATHTSGTNVWAIESAQFVMSFPPLYFESPLSSNYVDTFAYPNRLLVASEMYATNQIGNGLTTTVCYMTLNGSVYSSIIPAYALAPGMPAGGLLSLGYGSATVNISVDGTLAIAPDVAPHYTTVGTLAVSRIDVLLKQATTGGPFTVNIKVTGSVWYTMTIADGGTVAVTTTAEVAPLPIIGPGSSITVDITAVGPTFPGAGLTILIYG